MILEKLYSPGLDTLGSLSVAMVDAIWLRSSIREKRFGSKSATFYRSTAPYNKLAIS